MIASDNQPASPFVIGSIIKDPTRFWGRKRECQDIFTRLEKMGSTSIVGPRRIGKSSLAYYIYMEGPKRLGETYEFVWLDSQSGHSSSVDHFYKVITNKSSLAYKSADNLTECLINFEDAVKNHNRKLALFINEFEILTDEDHKEEFGKQFYNTLRLLAEQGYCALITISCRSLKELCTHVLGVSSPFYNIFKAMHLQHFTTEEADAFLKHKHDNVTLTPSEIQFIQEKVNDYQHPLVLQIACDSVFKNRQGGESEKILLERIKAQCRHFLTHKDVREGRRMREEKAAERKTNSQGISKFSDLLISIFIPVLGIGILMLEYGILIQSLSNSQAVLLAIVTAMLGFAVLIFAGRSIDIIGESTFFELFLRLINQIPLLSNLADSVINAVDKLKK